MNKKNFKHKIKHAALFIFLSFALAGVGFNSASAINISQESLEVTDKSATTVVHDAGIGNLIIAPNLEFNRLNDFISYKLVIKNNDGKKYQIVSIADDNTNEAIELTYSYSTGMDANNKEITFTIKYIQASDSPLETITVIVKIVDEDEDSADVPIVIPDTGNNVSSSGASAVAVGAAAVYVVFAILCLVIYIIARRKGMNSHKVLLTSALLIGMVPAIAIAASSGEIQFIVDLTDVKLNGPYVVTFDTDGGEGDIPPQTVNNGDTVVRPSLTPVKEGYNFDGWVDEAGNLYDFDSPVTGPVTLKAKWTIKEYTVTFNSDGGAPTPDSQVVKYKEFATKPSEDPTKEHYVFSKWVDENGNEFDFSTPITDDIELVAEWEKEKYTVTYNSNGGSAVASETVEYQEKFTRPTDPTRTGYRFMAWRDENNAIYDFDTEAIKDITLTATWQIIDYTISYELNGGQVEGTNPTTYNVESDTITLINPTKPGSTLFGGVDKYEFTGWTGSNGTNPQLEVSIPTGSTGNKNYTANFAHYWKVFFLPGGPGAISEPDRFVEENTAIGTLPTVTPNEGYEFKGWLVSDHDVTEQPTDGSYVVKGVTNFIAVIEPIEYTVTLDANGGSYSGTTSKTYNIETSVTMWDPETDAEPTRTGYVFKGWTGNGITEPSKAKIEIPVGSMGDKTYTAKWAELFTVTFDSDGGSSVASQEVADGETATRPEDPTKTDYVVKYWMDANGNEFDFSTPITSDITLTAKWIPAVAIITPVEAGSDNNINLKMKQIAHPGETITDGYNFKDTVVTAFVRATDEDYEAMGSSLTSDNIVSDSSSLAPVYMWFDDTTGTMYWYTEAAKVKFTGTMGRLFAKFDALTDIDSFADFDTSDVTDMNRIFQNCRSLQDTIDPETGEVTKAVLVPIANWDVSNVKSFVFAFGAGADGDAPMISDFSPISGWNVGACEDFNQMFKYNRVLTNLDAFKDWDMTSATNIKNMFTGNTALVDASGLKDWNVINVTVAGFGNVFSSAPIRFQGNTDVLPQFTKRPGKWDTDAATVNGKYIPNS